MRTKSNKYLGNWGNVQHFPKLLAHLSEWVPVSITKFMDPLEKHSLLLWPLPQFALSIFIETNKNKALVLVYIESFLCDLVWSLMRLHFWVAWYLQRVQGYLFLLVLHLIREGQAIPNWSFGSEFLESSFGWAQLGICCSLSHFNFYRMKFNPQIC